MSLDDLEEVIRGPGTMSFYEVHNLQTKGIHFHLTKEKSPLAGSLEGAMRFCLQFCSLELELFEPGL